MTDSYLDHDVTSSFIEEQTITEQQHQGQHTQQQHTQQQHTQQHQQNKQMLPQLLTHLANDSAILALLTFSHLLLPVSKNSPLVVLLHWSPMEAVVVHQWAGRLGIGACVLHGVLHLMGKWWRLMDAIEDDVYSGGGRMASLWYEFLPPKSCWTNVLQSWSDWLTNNAVILASRGSTTVNDEGSGWSDKMVFEPEGCASGVNEDGVPCKMCFDYFVNLTGLLGLMALVILLVGSLGFIRRNYYRVFYM